MKTRMAATLAISFVRNARDLVRINALLVGMI